MQNKLDREGWEWPGDKGSNAAAEQLNNDHLRQKPSGDFFCPQLPGTVLRIVIPPGAVINLLNLIELTSPGGICIIIRLPILGGNFNLASIMDTIQKAGGSVEIVPEPE